MFFFTLFNIIFFNFYIQEDKLLNNVNRKIEIYQCNNNSNILNNFNNLIEVGLKNFINLSSIIFNIKKDFDPISKTIQNFYKKIIFLKNENIPINQKIIKLLLLIHNYIPDKNNKTLILKIYKKVLSIFF